MGIKEIKYKDNLLALFFSKDISVQGSIKFLTPDHYPLQVGLIEHAQGKIVPPHRHRDLHYNVNTTQEFIYVEKGKDIEVAIYNDEWEEVEKINMSAGDSILFCGGGHGLNIPPCCRLFEVKQGPYPGDKEAKIFKD